MLLKMRWHPSIAVVLLLHCFSCAFAQRFRLEPTAISPGQTPAARSNAAFQSFLGAGEVPLFGGKTSELVFGDTWIYDSVATEWSLLNVAGPFPRYDTLSAAVDFGGTNGKFLYIIGGRDSKKEVLKTSLMWAFQLSSREWSEVSVSVASGVPGSIQDILGRAAAAGGVTEERQILISHGMTGSGKASDAYMISFSTPLTAVVQQKVYHSVRSYNIGDPRAISSTASVVTPANELVIFGGCYETGLCPNQDSWAFDLFQKEWRYMRRGPSPRTFASMAIALPNMRDALMDPRQHVVLWGGLEESKQTFGVEKASPLEIDLLDVRGRKWTREIAASSTDSIQKRHGASMVLLGNGLQGNLYRYLVFGGTLADGSVTNELLTLDFDGTKASELVSGNVARMQGLLYVHGILMLIAFAILIPFGVFVARYMRLMSSSPKWFALHAFVQPLAVFLAWLGLIFAILGAQNKPRHTHAVIGICLMTLVSLQLLGGLPFIRPNPNSGLKRQIWSALHHVGGWITFSLGLLNCFIGLIVLVSPLGIWVAFLVFTALLVIGALMLEIRRLSRRDHKASRYIAEDSFGDLPEKAHQTAL